MNTGGECSAEVRASVFKAAYCVGNELFYPSSPVHAALPGFHGREGQLGFSGSAQIQSIQEWRLVEAFLCVFTKVVQTRLCHMEISCQ